MWRWDTMALCASHGPCDITLERLPMPQPPTLEVIHAFCYHFKINGPGQSNKGSACIKTTDPRPADQRAASASTCALPPHKPLEGREIALAPFVMLFPWTSTECGCDLPAMAARRTQRRRMQLHKLLLMPHPWLVPHPWLMTHPQS